MGDTGAMRHLQALIADVTWLETGRNLRWPDGVQGPTGDSSEVTTQGRDETQPERQRYRWKSWERRVADLTATSCAGHHHPLRGWLLCL
jgi:hypothetical protein